LPVFGSIGTRPPVGTRLEATYNVWRSYDGTTCCGSGPPANVSITLYVAGSITWTSSLWVLGT
jgi:hypothetical protein